MTSAGIPPLQENEKRSTDGLAPVPHYQRHKFRSSLNGPRRKQSVYRLESTAGCCHAAMRQSVLVAGSSPPEAFDSPTRQMFVSADICMYTKRCCFGQRLGYMPFSPDLKDWQKLFRRD